MRTIRLGIADQNLISREGLKQILSSHEPITVTREFLSLEALETAGLKDEIDVLLIDYTQGEFTEQTIQTLLEKGSPKVVGITSDCHAAIIRRLMNKGLHGHLLKDCDLKEIIDSVKETAEGNQFFCGQILDEINKSEGIETNHGCEPVQLSQREQEILNFIAKGLTTKQIAAELCLSFHTVLTHRKNMMNKLGTTNTAGLIIYAVRENLISPNRFLFSGD